MKWLSVSCLLLCASLLSAQDKSPLPPIEPAALKCSIGHLDPNRLEKWEFYTVTEYADAPPVRKWISEHDSLKSAMKACEKAQAAQGKIWKQQINQQRKRK